MKIESVNRDKWLWIAAFGVLFPLFIQLGGGIYRDINPMVDSQGVISQLPLPISILTSCLCFAILAFRSNIFDDIRPALAMVVGTIAASVVSLFFAADGVTSPARKLTMILQVTLPFVGLLLGQVLQDRRKIVARAFLIVLSVIVPLQLLATWVQGGLILTHYLYVFSIYSHFQYVTLILVCAFAYSLTSLWDEYKLWLSVMAVWIFVYVTASLSFLTIFAYLAVVFFFALVKLWAYRKDLKTIFIVLLLITSTALGSFVYFEKMDGQRSAVEGTQGLFHGKFKTLLEGKIPANVEERFGDWKLFGNGIVESGKTIVVGHPQPMPREIRSSPHNWYIDMLYTFGLVSLIPILGLITYTSFLCWRNRSRVPTETWWLTAIVFYLVIVDSNFKVTLRQPYPGIFAYFLWGMLLTRLRLLSAAKSLA